MKMNKLLRSCIIILGAFFIIAVTKTASSQSVGHKSNTPVINFSLGKVPGNGHGIEKPRYKRIESNRYERHDYDRDDHNRRDRSDRYERHWEKPVKHEKAYNKRW